jgi:hypothetical protein
MLIEKDNKELLESVILFVFELKINHKFFDYVIFFFIRH